MTSDSGDRDRQLGAVRQDDGNPLARTDPGALQFGANRVDLRLQRRVSEGRAVRNHDSRGPGGCCRVLLNVRGNGFSRGKTQPGCRLLLDHQNVPKLFPADNIRISTRERSCIIPKSIKEPLRL